MLKDLIEKIFRRKELAGLKKELTKMKARVEFLITGDIVFLNQHERRMILKAIEAPGYKAIIEDPETKAYVRIVFRGLRKKLKQSIKKEDDDTTLEAPAGLPIRTQDEESEK